MTENLYKQGTYTESEYASEWLNLRMRFPSDYEALPETVKAYNKNQNRETEEMFLQSRNRINGGYNIIAIVVSKNSAEDIEAFAEQIREEIEQSDHSLLEQYNLRVETTWDRHDFQLVGETYLLWRSAVVVYENGSDSRRSVSWNLF